MIPPLYRLVWMSKTWFSNLSRDVQRALTARARSRELKPGERLFSRGEQPDGIFGIIQGSIRSSGISGDGRQITLDFYGPGSWIGEVAALDGMPRAHDTDAVGPTSVLHVPSVELEILLRTNPDFSKALLQLEALRLRILLMALEQYSSQSLEQRLANRLLMLVGTYAANRRRGVELTLHLPQETLAHLIGSTRQRVNQILKDWEREGLIQQQYGTITLLNQKQLETLASS